MCPRHSIDFCPICGGGLCGIRIIDAADVSADKPKSSSASQPPLASQSHGLVICDECEAIWLEPDISTVHQYPDLDFPVSPVTGAPLWGKGSRWATHEEIEKLGWSQAVNPSLDLQPDPETDGDEQVV